MTQGRHGAQVRGAVFNFKLRCCAHDMANSHDPVEYGVGKK